MGWWFRLECRTEGFERVQGCGGESLLALVLSVVALLFGEAHLSQPLGALPPIVRGSEGADCAILCLDEVGREPEPAGMKVLALDCFGGLTAP